MAMQTARQALLTDRAILRVSGDDSEGFLQGLITNDIKCLTEQDTIYAALLSAQGKIQTDFLIYRIDNAFLIDLARDQAEDVLKKLKLYRMRAKVELENVSDTLSVTALWENDPSGQSPATQSNVISFVADPRLPALGWRCLAAAISSTDANAAEPTPAPLDDYNCHRIHLGVPEAGKDYPFASAYPHDAMLDLLNGVSFSKGCFVGQEVVSRMRHRDGARKRCLIIRAEQPLPASGTGIMAGLSKLGQLGSTCNNTGLAIVRVDRLKELTNHGAPLTCEGVPIAIVEPDWATSKVAPQAPEGCQQNT